MWDTPSFSGKQESLPWKQRNERANIGFGEMYYVPQVELGKGQDGSVFGDMLYLHIHGSPESLNVALPHLSMGVARKQLRPSSWWNEQDKRYVFEKEGKLCQTFVPGRLSSYIEFSGTTDDIILNTKQVPGITLRKYYGILADTYRTVFRDPSHLDANLIHVICSGILAIQAFNASGNVHTDVHDDNIMLNLENPFDRAILIDHSHANQTSIPGNIHPTDLESFFKYAFPHTGDDFLNERITLLRDEIRDFCNRSSHQVNAHTIETYLVQKHFPYVSEHEWNLIQKYTYDFMIRNLIANAIISTYKNAGLVPPFLQNEHIEQIIAQANRLNENQKYKLIQPRFPITIAEDDDVISTLANDILYNADALILAQQRGFRVIGTYKGFTIEKKYPSGAEFTGIYTTNGLESAIIRNRRVSYRLERKLNPVFGAGEFDVELEAYNPTN